LPVGGGENQLSEGRKRRAGSEPPPRLAPSIRSGLISGDGIVAAGRKKVFSRVAETRALAAQAGRARAARVSTIPKPCCGGSTTSAGSPPMRHTQALVVVNSFLLYLFTCTVALICLGVIDIPGLELVIMFCSNLFSRSQIV
jgi:hypothetical protein